MTEILLWVSVSLLCILLTERRSVVGGWEDGGNRAVEPLTLFLWTVLDFLYFTKNAKISEKLALKTIFVIVISSVRARSVSGIVTKKVGNITVGFFKWSWRLLKNVLFLHCGCMLVPCMTLDLPVSQCILWCQLLNSACRLAFLPAPCHMHALYCPDLTVLCIHKIIKRKNGKQR